MELLILRMSLNDVSSGMQMLKFLEIVLSTSIQRLKSLSHDI